MQPTSVLLAPLLFLIGACGASPDPVEPARKEANPASRLSPDTVAQETLVGGWYAAASNGVWTFKDDGYLTIAAGNSGFNWAILRYSGTSDRIELIDLSSPPVAGEEAGCAHENIGVYGYAIERDTLTLSRMDDPCGIRSPRLYGLELERIETPVQPGTREEDEAV